MRYQAIRRLPPQILQNIRISSSLHLHHSMVVDWCHTVCVSVIMSDDTWGESVTPFLNIPYLPDPSPDFAPSAHQCHTSTRMHAHTHGDSNQSCCHAAGCHSNPWHFQSSGREHYERAEEREGEERAREKERDMFPMPIKALKLNWERANKVEKRNG